MCCCMQGGSDVVWQGMVQGRLRNLASGAMQVQARKMVLRVTRAGMMRQGEEASTQMESGVAELRVGHWTGGWLGRAMAFVSHQLGVVHLAQIFKEKARWAMLAVAVVPAEMGLAVG